VTGAFGYWRESGRFVTFNAKAVILATGGIGKAYKITSNSWEYTADGHAMAYNAGAQMTDMEFIQFHPTGMVWPPSVRGILVTEAVRGEGGLLTNKNGERFMKNVDPKRMELSTRDIVAKAINTEVKEGRGSPHGGVFLDISHKPGDYIKKKLPSMYHQFKELGDVDITKGPMEVGPTTHYTMGGVKVDPETQMSRVPGLYAAGEVSGGMHGANRLGGNSLSDLLVFGRRAGLHAAEFAKAMGSVPQANPDQVKQFADELVAPFNRETGESPYSVHRDLQDTMQAKVGIIRNEEDLKSALEDLKALKARAEKVSVEGSRQYNPGWHLAIDLMNMITTSEMVALAALNRRESRGGHTRDEYPSYDPELEKVNSVIHKGPDGIVFNHVPKEEMPDELKALFTS
jgi:succinate dehydrogenase / fumarate reductase flavoprotein subunit